MHITTDLRITSLTFVFLSGGYDQFYRPMQMRADASLTENFMMATRDGNNINKNTLSGLANDYISPTPEAGSKIDIPQGWGSQRLAFIIKLEVIGPFGKREENITGFTSHCGISTGINTSIQSIEPRIDPNMIFYFNAVEELNHFNIVKPQIGIVDTLVPAKSLNILGNNYTNQKLYNLRPQDIFYLKQRSDILAHYYTDDITDYKITGKHTAARDLTNPTTLLTEVVTGLLIGDKKMRDYIGEPGVDVYSLASENNQEVNLNRIKFYEKLNKGNYGIIKEDGFTWAELVNNFPELNNSNIIHLHLPEHGKRYLTLDDTRNTEHFKGATIETVLVNSIVNILPSIMTKYLVIGFNFFIDSQRSLPIDSIGTPHSGFLAQPLTSIGRDYQMDINSLRAFQSDLIKEIHFNLLSHKVNSYELSMQISLYGICEIYISVNGNPMTPYHVPFYGNSYTSPLVTTNSNDGINFCQNIEAVLQATGLYNGNSVQDFEAMLRGRESYDGYSYSNSDHQEILQREFSFLNEGFVNDDIPGIDDEISSDEEEFYRF